MTMDVRPGDSKPKLLYVVNEAYFFLSHRLPVARAAQDAGFDVHVAAPADHVWAPDGFSVTEIENAGFTFHEIKLSKRGQNPVQELRTFAGLLRLYRRLKPEVVHHLTIKPNLYGGIAARVARVPAMVSAVTGTGQIFVAEGALAGARRVAVSRLLSYGLRHGNARAIFQNGEDMATYVERGIVPRERAVVIRGSGVNLQEFRDIPEPDSDPLVVMATRLIWEKGVREFVEAARALRREGVEARFALVGGTHPSNPRSVPEDQLRAWSDEGVVEWWGRREDMPDVLAQSHIVCLPSAYGEGVPRVLIEAAACGRPCVATDIPGCRDVVRAGVSGILVPPGDSQALGAALKRLIQQPKLRAQMGKAARRIAEADFDVRDVARETAKIYADLCQ